MQKQELEQEVMNYLRVTNWEKFQQCDRDAPWIKLHTRLLQDYEFMNISDSDRLGFILILVYAGRNGNKIPNDSKWLSSIFIMDGFDINKLIEMELLEEFDEKKHTKYNKERKLRIENRRTKDRDRKRDKQSNSESDLTQTFSDPQDSASSETETETETETDINTHLFPEEKQLFKNKNLEVNRKGKINKQLEIVYSEDFLEWYKHYPRKSAKQDAFKAWNDPNYNFAFPPLKEMIAAVELQKRSAAWTKDDGGAIPFPATWLRGKRWEDEPYVPPVAEDNYVR